MMVGWCLNIRWAELDQIRRVPFHHSLPLFSLPSPPRDHTITSNTTYIEYQTDRQKHIRIHMAHGRAQIVRTFWLEFAEKSRSGLCRRLPIATFAGNTTVRLYQQRPTITTNATINSSPSSSSTPTRTCHQKYIDSRALYNYTNRDTLVCSVRFMLTIG